MASLIPDDEMYYKMMSIELGRRLRKLLENRGECQSDPVGDNMESMSKPIEKDSVTTDASQPPDEELLRLMRSDPRFSHEVKEFVRRMVDIEFSGDAPRRLDLRLKDALVATAEKSKT